MEHDGGAYDIAAQSYHEALAIARELDEPRVQAIMLGSLATLHATRGELDRAGEQAREALAHTQRFGDIAASPRRARGWRRAETACSSKWSRCAAQHPSWHARALRASPEPACATRSPRRRPRTTCSCRSATARSTRASSSEFSNRARALGDQLGETQPSSSHSPKLQVAADGRWFQLRGQPRIAMAQRPILASLLAVLANARAERAGTGVNADDLFEAAWKGERAVRRARAARVYVAISSLRKLGLSEVLRRTHEGYLFDPAIPFEKRANS